MTQFGAEQLDGFSTRPSPIMATYSPTRNGFGEIMTKPAADCRERLASPMPYLHQPPNPAMTGAPVQTPLLERHDQGTENGHAPPVRKISCRTGSSSCNFSSQRWKMLLTQRISGIPTIQNQQRGESLRPRLNAEIDDLLLPRAGRINVDG